MTDQPDPDLRALDDAAGVASRGLHQHVAHSIDTEMALVTLPVTPVRRGRGRFLAVAAVAALLVGSVVTLSDQQGDGGDRSRLELDEDGNRLPTPEPGMLTPLGPRDGKDSIQLPVAITPVEGLSDGDVVTVSSPGFEPGEQVGIVQCAKEAGGDTPEQRGGVDGCNIGTVQYAEADAAGLATGQFTVRRTVTTPLTGTVDCAAEANRCIVAMGAINDYDRSGGMGFTIAGGGEPIVAPTLAVSPAEGLQDGDVVRVDGDGYAPRSIVNLSVCSKDPATCWTTGAEIAIEGDGGGAEWFGYDDDGSGGTFIGLQADADGRLRGDVPVWRFLPGETPGTYVDCALSECSLRLSTDADAAPPPARLGFAPGGDGPIPPAVAVDPANNLAPGDTVVVRGAGFAPDANFHVSLCVSPADRPDELFNCFGGGNGEDRADRKGTFAVEFDIPDPQDDFGYVEEVATTTTACADPTDCVVLPSPATPATPAFSCDGGVTICSIRVDAYSEDQGLQLRPSFPPAPVIVTFRPAG